MFSAADYKSVHVGHSFSVDAASLSDLQEVVGETTVVFMNAS